MLRIHEHAKRLAHNNRSAITRTSAIQNRAYRIVTKGLWNQSSEENMKSHKGPHSLVSNPPKHTIILFPQDPKQWHKSQWAIKTDHSHERMGGGKFQSNKFIERNNISMWINMPLKSNILLVQKERYKLTPSARNTIPRNLN